MVNQGASVVRWIDLAEVLVLLAAWTGVASAQEPAPLRHGTAVVTGTVHAADTDEPVPDASIELFRAADATRVAQTLTGAEGRFRFIGLHEGLY